MSSHVSGNNDGMQYVEKLLRENDLKGAIDFAKRVNTSSRKLKRLVLFLGNIVVQASSEGEETDWYTVLGVDPSADLKTMQIQYVELVKQMRKIGSFQAHKLLDKAWIILSNKVTRKDYDIRRRSREQSQHNSLSVRQENSAIENVPHALENVANTVVSDQRNDFTDQREINAIDWDSIWNPQENFARSTEEFQQNLFAGIEESSAAEIFSHSLENVNNAVLSDQRNDFTDQREINAVDWDCIWDPPENNASLRRRLREESRKYLLAVKQERSATKNLSHALENVNNAVVSNQRNEFTDQREINAIDWNSIWNPRPNHAPHDEPLDSVLIACPSCHYESHRVCLISKADCLHCGKSFAAIEVPSPDAKHKEVMSLVQESGDTIKNVPENHMPVGSDGQGGVYLCQAGMSRAENIGSSKRSKGNGESFSDLEKNNSITKAKNEIPNKLHERNAAATDQTKRNAAATEGPGMEEDGLKTMEIPDSRDFDQGRTQESENQLNAVYAEMMDGLSYFSDF